MKHSNIFFPIEPIDRELDAKLLLASLLSNKVGYIIIAQHDLVIKLINLSLNGIYFGKNIMNPKKIQMYRSAEERGFVIAHLDEEFNYKGLQPEIESMLDTRLDVTTMKSDDYVFTCGKFQEDYYKSKCNDSNQPFITTTGNIRLDLFKKQFRNYYEDEAKIYREKYGPYIFIPTTFGYAMNPYGYSDTFSERTGYGVSKFKSSDLVKKWSTQMHQLSHLIELIHVISPKFPEFQIIVRPHVAEDIAFYCSALDGLDNVKVLRGGTSGPWVAASDLLIHNGSTVGIEAYFQQKPVVNYEFISNEKADSLIINKIGRTCKNPQEVIEAINDVVKGKKIHDNEKFDEFDYRLLDQLKNDDYMKLPKLLEELIKNKSSKDISKTVPIIRLFLIEYLYQILNFIKKPIRKFFFPKLQRMYLADQTSFPGFNKSDLLSRLNRIEKLTGNKFKIKFIGKRIFFIKVISGKD